MQRGSVATYDLTRPPHNLLPNPYGLLTVLIAPLLVNEQLTGFLTFDHGDKYYAFSSSERQLASAVAHLAGLVIERERLTEEQLRSDAHAMALEETMGHMQRFLGITTHELRTPLTAIKANVQFVARGIQRGVESGDLAEPLAAQMQRAVDRLEMVDKQADQMNRFITDLLDTTRIQVGKLELHKSREDAVEIAREVVRLLQVTWRERTITLEAPTGPLFVSGDSGRISQVLTNLINNALKYSPGTCPVRVEVKEQPDVVRVAVIDQGPGLTAAQQQHLFDAFVQAEGIHEQTETATGKPGLGLGLFIARAIVTQHGGKIGVETVRGAGATFWFTLPLCPLEEEADPAGS
jgi:signal transduction histidine kinase